MSARKANVRPGRPPRSRATTLVGVGLSTSRPPKDSSTSRTNAAVRCSQNDSSGSACRCRLHATASGTISSMFISASLIPVSTRGESTRDAAAAEVRLALVPLRMSRLPVPDAAANLAHGRMLRDGSTRLR